MLKYITTDIESLDEAQQALYESDGNGQYILQVEGAVPKAQLDEFRANNLKLKTALEKFNGLDPDKAAEIAAAYQGVTDGTYVENAKKTDVDAIVEKRIAEMQRQHETELTSATETAAKLKTELETVKVNQALLTAGATAGLRKGAEADLLSRGREVFSVDNDGNLVARDEKGEMRYGAAGQPLTPSEFIKDLASKAEHLFDANAGGGAIGGAGSGGSGSGVNPWKKETYNLTEQALLIKKDPAKAKEMAAKAGVPISVGR